MTGRAHKHVVGYLGALVRPNGSRMPITGLHANGKITVRGVYVEFETTLGAAIVSGYALEDACPAVADAWEVAARCKADPHSHEAIAGITR
jgi:hypothetical protein